jgi:NAD-dependent dihydropyrimidine dehydrogenase PreA subunit
MKAKRKIIEIDEQRCNGCGICVSACAEGALRIIDGKAKVVSDVFCDGLGACLGECPQDALRIVEREADEFDHRAVEAHLTQKEAPEKKVAETLPCGCPSTRMQSFAPAGPHRAKEAPVGQWSSESALSHWPIQIKLVPPQAPFLKGADLLVAADCTSFSYGNFHRDFLEGRVLLIGCPKLDEVEPYVQKFADIFTAADIRSVTVVVMEVPCCQGLPVVVKKGMDQAGKQVPMDKVIISTRGEILQRQKLVA